MSPSSGNDVPNTPQRKASGSTLLNAWKSLTNSRSKSSNASLTSAVSPIPVQAIFAGAKSPSDGPPHPPKAKWADLLGEEAVAEGSTEPVHGGPKELAKLLYDLRPEHSIPQRVAAAESISVIISEYPVSNLLAIWGVAEDLWEETDETASAAGLKLLLSCASSETLSPAERLAFFESVSNRRGDETLENSFDALVALTNNGKNAEALEGELPNYLANLLQACFDSVWNARRREKKLKTQAIAKEETLFSRLLQYIADVAKFNSRLLSDAAFEMLLKNIIDVCKRTNSETDLDGCINLVGALITYTNVPPAAITPCVEVLADIYRQIKTLRKPVWATFKDLFRSHLGHSTVNALLDILHRVNSSMEDQKVSVLCARGAFEVLSKVIFRAGKPGIPAVSLNLFVHACNASLSINKRDYFEEVVQFFTTALSTEETLQSLLDEADWSELLSLVLACSDKSMLHGTRPVGGTSNQSHRSASPLLDEKMMGDGDVDGLSNAVLEFADRLNVIFPRLDFVQRQSVIDFFLRLSSWVSVSALDTVLDYYSEEQLLWLSNPDWLESCHFFADTLLKNNGLPSEMRVRMVNMLRAIYDAASTVESDNQVEDLALLIVRDISGEDDIPVLENLCDFATGIVQWSSQALFDDIMSLIKPAVLKERETSPDPPFNMSLSRLSPDVAPVDRQTDTQPNIITRALVRMFLRTVNTSASKAQYLFDLLLEVASRSKSPTDARISALKLFFRLRCDSNLAIYVNASSECESIAAVLCRTADTANAAIPNAESPQPRRPKSDRDSPFSEKRSASGDSSNLPFYRHRNARIHATVRPLWMYPGPRGLPEEPSKEASSVLFSATVVNPEEESLPPETLRMSAWLELVFNILKDDGDWELYSYTLVHLGAQLANPPLFMDAVPYIRSIRSLLCEQIRNNSFHEPPGYTSLRKAEVAICIFHILTILIAHHDHFSKSDEDEMVRAFLSGIGGWEPTANWCIHALSVSCHELQASVSKSLEPILQKMSQIITQQRVQIHVLEFLAGLSRLPELFKNFREEDYKMVFGISFRFLEASRDDRDKKKHQSSPPGLKGGSGSLRHSAGSRDLNALSESGARYQKSAVESDLPQYVYALAHHVISFWFLSLRLEDRPKYLPWITSRLIYKEGTGSNERDVLEEQGMVTIDMMQRVAYSERGDTTRNDDFAKPSDGEVAKKSWVVGMSIITIETAGRTGASQITIRRPSATRYSLYSPQLAKPPRHQVYLSADVQDHSIYTSSYIGVLPDDIIQDYYAPLMINALPYSAPDMPIPLPEDDATKRAINIFDRNMTVDSHKVGIIFVGDGQTTEDQIFANVMGSADYTSFTTSLGTLMRLKGADFNTQGLDREFDTDGEFTIAWRDRVTELVFHITTMMPTDLEHDPKSISKKRHTGNDFVNIVWNNSGIPFMFDTFPSAFNYVYIVITPTARASFVDTRVHLPEDDNASIDLKSETKSVLSSAPTTSDDTTGALHPAPERHQTAFSQRYYRVQVLSAPDFPSISPAAEGKIVSGKSLPQFVRLLALNASVFSLVWANREGGEHVSSWRNRLREIKRLKEKHGPPTTQTHQHNGSNSNLDNLMRPPSTPLGTPGERNSMVGAVTGIMGLSDRRPQPHARDSNASGMSGFKRMSAMTVVSDDTGNGSRTSLLSTGQTAAESDRKEGTI